MDNDCQTIKILGLDIAKKTGFALIQKGKLLKYGVYIIETPMTYANLNSWLAKIIVDEKPDAVCIEDTWAGKNIGTLKNLCYLQGAAMAAIEQAELAFCHLTPPEIKKAVIGWYRKGKITATKDDVRKAVEQRFRSLPKGTDENVIDAIATALAFTDRCDYVTL